MDNSLINNRINQAILDSLLEQIAVVDRQGNIIMVNKAWTDFAVENNGMVEKCGVGTNYLSVCKDSNIENVVQGILSVLNGTDDSFKMEYVCHCLERRRWFLLYVTPILADGIITGAVITHINISEQKLAEEKRNEIYEKYKLIAENSSDLIKLIDLNGTIIYSSPSHRNMGYDSPSCRNHLFTEFIHIDDIDDIKKVFSNVIQNKVERVVEHQTSRSDGEWIWVESKFSPVFDDKGEVKSILQAERNITERKSEEMLLKHLAFHDQLTDLPNRRMFNKKLEEVLKKIRYEPKMLAVFYLDCDKFKEINDSMGHDVGDEVLKGIGQRITSCIKETDMAARIGGDEFVLLITGVTSRQEVIAAANSIKECLDRVWQIKGYQIKAACSIGIAFYPEHGMDAATLIKNADAALYQAKEQGRDNYQVYKKVKH